MVLSIKTDNSIELLASIKKAIDNNKYLSLRINVKKVAIS